ncbi:hypothetical protein DWY25_17345 [Holdemania filiformis]|uniref:Uncharacterized protein n=1 Tax=Holdemania filiformis TaxID=61171 RepID=A0A412FF50_9FIRM|nr:hypothetical protein [Holdemania filiformis]RGR66880.1 hypothetical protein DWY25_17345 [Holdemania filiformis]
MRADLQTDLVYAQGDLDAAVLDGFWDNGDRVFYLRGYIDALAKAISALDGVAVDQDTKKTGC